MPSTIPIDDNRRKQMTELECAAGLLSEVRINLSLAGRPDLAVQITPLIRATRAAIKRRRARGIMPDLNDGESRVGKHVFITKQRR